MEKKKKSMSFFKKFVLTMVLVSMSFPISMSYGQIMLQEVTINCSSGDSGSCMTIMNDGFECCCSFTGDTGDSCGFWDWLMCANNNPMDFHP
jgi:hypothetical protein